jgi:hypothetical protein
MKDALCRTASTTSLKRRSGFSPSRRRFYDCAKMTVKAFTTSAY